MDKIFIQICSYRDIHLISTVKDLLLKVSDPLKLRVVIAWQHDNNENIDVIKNLPNVEVIDIPYTETKGVGWARNLLQQQYRDEMYVLQLDSHHKFVQNWDLICIQMIKELQEKGYKKPILTTYLPGYDEITGNTLQDYPTRIWYAGFKPNGLINFAYGQIEDHKQKILPEKARFYSGHFVFTLGNWNKEVLYDPECWSIFAEEINMGVRSFTHGYDLFHPHKLIAYHCYNRGSRWSHHYDIDNLNERLEQSATRTRQLFGTEINNINFGVHSLGNIRTFLDYEKYAGLNFTKRIAQFYTRLQKPPPGPVDYFDMTTWSNL